MRTCSYGTIFNKNATLYYLENDNFKVSISDFGGILKEFIIKTKSGNKDIVLGFDDAVAHSNSNIYAGAFIGRVANGIKGATFNFNGKTYNLYANEENGVCNHGGKRGFDRQFYAVSNYSDTSITLSRTSVDGEENFPANLKVEVTYSLKSNGLRVDIKAEADGDTYFAPTMHPYFNLSGKNQSVENTLIKINAQNYTLVDAFGLPNGEIAPCKNTVYDFLEFKEIGSFLYDTNFCCESEYKASAINSESGLKLDVYSNLKGVQFYVPNYEEKIIGKNGQEYKGKCAFCLEPQFYPNAVNVENFEKPLIKKGEEKNYYIEYLITEVKK